ncbi:MAG: hypothetical protein NC818_02405 [Candidatus Omnitrophica bacterium]|nr:hypothetical protein [Candidatus Omnitrophota bacterium]
MKKGILILAVILVTSLMVGSVHGVTPNNDKKEIGVLPPYDPKAIERGLDSIRNKQLFNFILIHQII